MYTVSWMAKQLGLSPGTLRAWEQRYGVVSPTRSDNGYRIYDDDDLAVLRAMAELVDVGVHPAQAAEQVRHGRPGPALDLTGTAPTPAGLPDPSALIAASRTYDARALDETLDVAFACAGFEYVVDVWLTGALATIGRGWADGRLDIAQEHFVSSGVMRRLAAAFDAAGYSRTGPHVVTGLAPGATHEIATLAFATMLRRRGLRVTYLGPDLPLPSWVEAVRAARPHAAVVGAPRAADTRAATEVVEALQEASPHTAVHAGGPGAVPPHSLGGPTLAESANWLADALTARPRHRPPSDPGDRA